MENFSVRAFLLSRMSGAVPGQVTVGRGALSFQRDTTRYLPWFRVGFGRGQDLDIPLSIIERVELLPPSRYPALRRMAGVRVHLRGAHSVLLRTEAAASLVQRLTRQDAGGSHE